jgi:hypothetical protein
MPWDGMFSRDPGNPWCRACREPIWQGQPATRVDFATDPDGSHGLTGMYHPKCSRAFQALARVVNMNPWGGL